MTVQEILLDQTLGDDALVPCGSCATNTYHGVLKSADVKIGFMSGTGFIHYQIIQCQGCRNLSYRTLTKKTDLAAQIIPGRKTKQILTLEELYPRRYLKRRESPELLAKLPANVFRIYRETLQALRSNQQVLAGIGIRALLEAVCVERAAPGNTLQSKIDGLVGLGLLTQSNADFLHGLRIMGNQAAHQVTPHSEDKLGLAMDMIEHLLASVYVIPAKANQFSAPPAIKTKP